MALGDAEPVPDGCELELCKLSMDDRDMGGAERAVTTEDSRVQPLDGVESQVTCSTVERGEFYCMASTNMKFHDLLSVYYPAVSALG